jgi:hypothetical protein
VFECWVEFMRAGYGEVCCLLFLNTWRGSDSELVFHSGVKNQETLRSKNKREHGRYHLH